MSKKKTWADVRERDRIELKGAEWAVVSVKLKKKKAVVEIEKGGRIVKAERPLDEKVKVTGRPKKGKLYDADGRAQRWATPAEAAKAERDDAPRGLEPGDSTMVKPPAKAAGDPWERPADRIEKKLDAILGARLVGESTEKGGGYYVPPVNVSTVAAHLVVFHGGIPEACGDDEGAMLVAHTAQHEAAKKGEGVLAVNHWHTAVRP